MSQAVALAVVQDAIVAQHPSLSIELIAQVHYIRPDDVAHIDVHGCDDAVTRRAIRTEAVRLLGQLAIHVELVGGHDVYTVSPDYSDPVALQDYARKLPETISEYAARVIGDNPIPAARIAKPRKRKPPPWAPLQDSDGDD